MQTPPTALEGDIRDHFIGWDVSCIWMCHVEGDKSIYAQTYCYAITTIEIYWTDEYARLD